MIIQSVSSHSLTGIGSMAQYSRPAHPTVDGKSFKDLLLDSINDVNTLQQDADRAVERLNAGEDVNPAEVITAAQKADVAMRTMMEIRDKLVAAYDEVKNIRV